MEDEVKHAIFSLDAISSPGPDGFGEFFYHKCWDIIAMDVFNAIIHLFSTLNIPEGMNSSLVMLIPKVANSIRVTDF